MRRGLPKSNLKFEIEMSIKYDLVPEECWVVGDKWIDSQTGINSGMKGGLVRTGKPIDSKIERMAKEHHIPIHDHLGALLEAEVLQDE